jgi:hypothetical protein
MRRAQERLNAISKQDPLKAGQIAPFEIGLETSQPRLMENLWFTSNLGEHARTFFITGENTAEFRKQLKEAADAGLLRNKQIALATCFDENETEGLRDMLLDSGALIVWSPNNKISPEAAKKLRHYMEKADVAPGPASKGLHEYMDRVLKLWYQELPKDPELAPLLNSPYIVELSVFDRDMAA